MSSVKCKSCWSPDTEVFFEQTSVPTNSCILIDSEQEAKSYPRGDIVLAFCKSCGFVFNQAFDPKLTEYSGRYEETQAFSGTFNAFHYDLADRLIEKHGLGPDTRVLEIGCGKGEFLQMLCERSGSSGIGFDPGYQDGRLNVSDSADVNFVKDFYSEKYVDQSADFVCCKMTLEHIPEAKSFMQVVRQAIADDTADVFFQIPESERILSTLAFEDVYYEHCNYFTPHSLAALFRDTQFGVNDVSIEYDDQYLTIEAVTGSEGGKVDVDADAVARSWELAKTYQERVNTEVRRWRDIVDAARAQDQKVVLWGSGSKGVSFLTALQRDDQIAAVVDINPNRTGYFMCGSGHPIVSPDQLKELQPDLVIVMNRIYVAEIEAMLKDRDLDPRVLALGAD